MRYHVNFKVSNVNQSNVTNTLNDAKIVFSFENLILINSLFDILEKEIVAEDYNSNNAYTLLKLLKEKLNPNLFIDLQTLFNSFNLADHGTN